MCFACNSSHVITLLMLYQVWACVVCLYNGDFIIPEFIIARYCSILFFTWGFSVLIVYLFTIDTLLFCFNSGKFS